MIIKLRLLMLVLFMCLCASSYAQKYLNLDFDKAPGKDKPSVWYVGGSGYEAVSDTQVYYSSKSSLRFKAETKTENSFGVATGKLPVRYAAGKKIKFTGYIKTKNVKDGYAGLWIRVDGFPQKTLAFDNMNDRGVKGSTKWKKYEINIVCDSEAFGINFGCLFNGVGAAWFDKLEISLDGVPFVDKDPVLPPPKHEEIDWIKNNCIPLKTVEAGNGFDDLQKLKEFIGDAKIVGLGESTHGTHEIFEMKHRIVEFLAEEMGFTVFAIEANMPEAYKLNDYILNGAGDPKDLIAGMYFWTWNTGEVLDMVEWMRRFNSSGKGKIFFTGFDMQFMAVAADVVGNFINKNDPAFADEYGKDIDTLKKLNDFKIREDRTDSADEYVNNITKSILNRLEENKEKYLALNPKDTVEWVLQNAKIIQQANRKNMTRDPDMADNIEWILNSFPEGTKMVLWAHNYHISREPNAMGDFLNKKFGSGYKPIGFAIGKGTYRAKTFEKKVEWVHDLTEAYNCSFEYYFHLTGIPIFFLDIQSSVTSGDESAFMRRTLDFRSIGAIAMDEQFSETPITDYFDGIIYIDNTTNSVTLVNY